MGVPNGYTSAQVVQAVPTGINSALVCVKAETAFTSASSVTVDNVFTSSYTNYLIKLLYKTDVAIRLGLRIGGVTTATNYNRVQLRVEGTTAGVSNLSSQTGFQVGEQTSGSLLEATSEIYIYAPQLAQRTFLWATNMHNQSAYAGSSQYGDSSYGNQNSTTQFDGLEFNGATTMTATGTYTIYGFGKTV